MKISFRDEGEIKILSDEMKLREVVASRPVLKESLKENFRKNTRSKLALLGMREEQQKW